jgi:predicted DNA-binding transcriptional regulator
VSKQEKDKLTKSQNTLHGYLAKTRGKYFNEMCWELVGKLSRRTIAKSLIVLKKKGYVKSELVNRNFREHSVYIHRWVRKYTALK